MEKTLKIFILTYKAPDDLARNLRSLFSSETSFKRIEVNVINNHSDIFEIPEEYKDRVIVHNQSLRADWGCGTPARDWNQALVLGFKNLITPVCEQIILCQDDCIWEKDWLESLDKIHKQYDFYQCSWGDCFLSILPSAIKKIGLFDERMCTLGYYEGDFLLRAWLYNRDKSSINDFHHKRVWNETLTVANRASDEKSSPRYMNHSGNIFAAKWPGIDAQRWHKSLFNHPPKHSAIENYIFYPYFECDIDNLKEKRYVIV
jgi:hypothetical protein